jgi:curved DNA-binding protein CbpA
MIRKVEDLNYYELLEVSPSATTQDIHRAYERIRRVYEPNSIALYSLFTAEESAVIHRRIEEAYRTLVYEDNRKRYDELPRSRQEIPELPPAPPKLPPTYQARKVQPALPLQSGNRYMDDLTGSDLPPVQPPPPQPSEGAGGPPPQFTGEFTGPAVKLMREQRGMSLRNVADATKVSARYLEYIEEENFSKLPARPYLRGFLQLYAKALGYEPDRMISDYLKRYDAAMNHPKK